MAKEGSATVTENAAPPPLNFSSGKVILRIAWAIGIIAAFNLWSQFILGIDLSKSALVTLVSAAAVFCIKTAAAAMPKPIWKDAVRAGARLLFDVRLLFAATVLLLLAVLAFSSVIIVNDTNAKGTITVRSMAMPRSHYIPNLSDKASEYRSVIFAPYRGLRVSTGGRTCNPSHPFPLVPRKIYLSSCARQPSVLVRIPLGAQMHLENGKLEVIADGCPAAIRTNAYVAGLWIGNEKGDTQGWRQRWLTAVAESGLRGPDASAAVDLWNASPLHQCKLGPKFNLTAIFSTPNDRPIAAVETVTIEAGEEPLDFELVLR